ncbi:DUF3147 family protein [Poseidonia sp.]|uniref:DUF3147 family protein n=1 Tax=Poseidonia sp. TaxID=2666344 RepID=UPI003F697ADA
MYWYQFLIRILLSGALIVAATELAKRSTIAGALLISLPLASIATLIWLHIDGQETEQLALFSKEVLWLVIPSMVFFLSLPILLNRGVEFWPSLMCSLALTSVCYASCLWLISNTFGTS